MEILFCQLFARFIAKISLLYYTAQTECEFSEPTEQQQYVRLCVLLS